MRIGRGRADGPPGERWPEERWPPTERRRRWPGLARGCRPRRSTARCWRCCPVSSRWAAPPPWACGPGARATPGSHAWAPCAAGAAQPLDPGPEPRGARGRVVRGHRAVVHSAVRGWRGQAAARRPWHRRPSGMGRGRGGARPARGLRAVHPRADRYPQSRPRRGRGTGPE